jgi:hypothetical protein
MVISAGLPGLQLVGITARTCVCGSARVQLVDLDPELPTLPPSCRPVPVNSHGAAAVLVMR